jgi:hypothetical protein
MNELIAHPKGAAMIFPGLFRQAALAGLCAATLVAAPDPHQAIIANRSAVDWELWLGASGNGTLRVAVRSKGGKTVTREYRPGESWLIKLKPQAEATLSFLEGKEYRSRAATLGVAGALEEQASGLYIQDGGSGIILARTGKNPFRQKNNRLEIRDSAGPACAIL